LPLSYASDAPETILIIGVNRITDLYLRASAEFSHGRIRVVGLLATKERHTGRLVHEHGILGTTEEVSRIVRDLEVHGVRTDRIVVTVAFDALPARARSALLDVERNCDIKVEFFADNIGIVGRPVATVGTIPHEESVAQPAMDLVGKETAARPYWRIKRMLDVLAVTTVFVLLAPLILLIAALVAIDVGFPVIFWQQRPGKDGRSFRLYKFRTMRAPHDREGRRVADAARLSVVGNFLRRLRLDELPQLYNVLIGEMSLIGPRPLLPHDQFPGLTARLAIRPGLTGWAQVKGGRDLTPSDKAALDVWYVRNGSFRVDLEIVLGTLRLILLGERTDWDAIRTAWREIGCDRLEQPQRAAYERVDHTRRPLSNGARGEKEEHGSTALVSQ
jgi:lipopolysaccharide/colanic/teichoic acid biosynthesis glycosyltransferase